MLIRAGDSFLRDERRERERERDECDDRLWRLSEWALPFPLAPVLLLGTSNDHSPPLPLHQVRPRSALSKSPNCPLSFASPHLAILSISLTMSLPLTLFSLSNSFPLYSPFPCLSLSFFSYSFIHLAIHFLFSFSLFLPPSFCRPNSCPCPSQGNSVTVTDGCHGHILFSSLPTPTRHLFNTPSMCLTHQPRKSTELICTSTYRLPANRMRETITTHPEKHDLSRCKRFLLEVQSVAQFHLWRRLTSPLKYMASVCLEHAEVGLCDNLGPCPRDCQEDPSRTPIAPL